MTVGEFIALLQQFSSDRRLTLCDPDTGWSLRPYVCEANDGWIEIGAEYEDHEDGERESASPDK